MEKIASILCVVADFVKPVLWGYGCYAALDKHLIEWGRIDKFNSFAGCLTLSNCFVASQNFSAI